MKLFTRSKNTVFTFLIIWPPFAYFLFFALNLNFFWGTLLYFGVPIMAILPLISKTVFIKTTLFSTIFGVPATLIIGYVASVTGSWYIPHSFLDQYRFFGQVSFGEIIWAVLWLLFVVLLYESFFDKLAKERLVWPKMKIFGAVWFSGLAMFLVFLNFFPNLLLINYSYLKFGFVVCLLPTVLMLWTHPRLVTRVVAIGLYLFYFSLVYEIVAVKMGHWVFPDASQFIGQVTILGATFPFEEFFFWILLGSSMAISWYEYFDDDGK